MKLLRWEMMSAEETLDRLAQTRLRGHGQKLIYEKARLSVVQQIDTDRLVPAQRYLWKRDLDNAMAMQRLFAQEGLDVFALEGTVMFWIERDGEEEGPIPMTPPIVEESIEADGQKIWLINDGMHRIAAARSLGRKINVILAENVPAEYPYYAFPAPGGWQDVQTYDLRPEGATKKLYRFPETYKDLFRDFNDVFPGMQKDRRQAEAA